MRNLISGIVGLTLGSLCLLSNLIKGGPQGEGAYFAGQVCGLIMGILFFLGGIVYLVLGVRGLDHGSRKKRRRVPRASDVDYDYRSRRNRRSDEDDSDDDYRPRKRRGR
jgi:hypothetical protein